MSILLALFCSFIFYFFLQYLFVLIRNLNSAFVYNSNDELTPALRNSIALLFSSLSVSVGNCLGIAYLFSGVTSDKNRMKAGRRIINDQSVLTPTAIYWFVKIAIFTIGSILISYSTGFLDEFIYIIPLFSITLFLDQVKGLRRFVSGYNILKMLIHGSIIALLTCLIAFTNINLYDVQGNSQKESRLYAEIPAFDIDLEYDNKIVSFSYENQIRFKVTQIKDSIRIFNNDRYLSLCDVQTSTLESRRSHYRQEAIFYIDQSIPWYKLQPLFESLQLVHTQKVYITFTNTKDFWNAYYKHYIALTKERYQKWEKSSILPPPLPPPPYFEDFTTGMKIDTLSISHFTKHKVSTKDTIASYVYESGCRNTARIINVDREVTVNDYLQFMIGYKKGIYRLRRRYRNHPHLQDGSSEIKEFPLSIKEVYK